MKEPLNDAFIWRVASHPSRVTAQTIAVIHHPPTKPLQLAHH